MNSQEVIERIRVELEMPFFEAKLETKEYTEADYQKIKADLVKYYDDYVRNVEN